MLSLMQEIPTVPAPPQPPAIPSVSNQAGAEALANAAGVYQGAVSQRRELQRQVERLEGRRSDLVRELSDEGTPAAAKVGIEARLKELDARLSATEQQLAVADQAVARTAAVPGATVEPPQPPRDGPPDDVFIIVPVMLILFGVFPFAIAYARRIWKRSATVISPIPQEVRDRLEQLGQSVESVALEVERIGEGQRFITKVMSENGRTLGAGAAQPIPVPQAHAEHIGVRSGA